MPHKDHNIIILSSTSMDSTYRTTI